MPPSAVSDLRVNLWVAGPSRVGPSNYVEMEIDDARISWFDGGANYVGLVKTAANEAGGNAFVTEYAGTARIMDKRLWTPGKFNLKAARLKAVLR